MSFNLNKIGRPICVIHGGKYDGKVVYYSDEDVDLDDESPYKNFTALTLKDGKFGPTVNIRNERDILAMFGPSGSGKSYFAKQYLKQYEKIHKKNSMFILSTVEEDKSLEDVKELQRVVLNEEWITDPLDIKDFGEDCLLMLDDIDTIRNRDIKNSVDELKNEILETGRHTHTSALITSHLCCKGKETKNN